MQAPCHTECYRGQFACPDCCSKETGTSTIATSERWIVFECDSCGWVFKRSAAKVSSLSRSLRDLAGAASDFSNKYR